MKENGTNYPSVTLTRSFLPPGLGLLEVSFGLANAWLPLDSQLRGFLWTRNCVVTFGLAIAWYLPLGLTPPDEYCWFYVPCFTFLVAYYWFYIPSFIFQDWECFGGLGLASRPRLGLLYIPGFIFLVLYSWFYIPGFVFLAFRFHFRFQIVVFRFQILYSRFQLSAFRFQILDFGLYI